MNDFENKKTEKEEIYYSRYIVSWLNACTKNMDEHGVSIDFFDEDFSEWLEKHGLTRDEICNIRILASCGKVELQDNADEFLNRK